LQSTHASLNNFNAIKQLSWMVVRKIEGEADKLGAEFYVPLAKYASFQTEDHRLGS